MGDVLDERLDERPAVQLDAVTGFEERGVRRGRAAAALRGLHVLLAVFAGGDAEEELVPVAARDEAFVDQSGLEVERIVIVVTVRRKGRHAEQAQALTA